MNIPYDKVRWSQDNDGVWLSLRAPSEYRPQVIQYANAFDRAKPHAADLREQKKRRSLDANAYAWVLMDKLAQRTGIPKSGIYREYMRNIGGNTETVCIRADAAEKLRSGWEHNGLGWITDTVPSKLDGCVNVILYYGSSTFDTAQMSRLIDALVQDCREQGIETMTPRELARLVEEWA